MLTTVISFVIVLGVLIFVHEFGHYIIAKWADIRVEEFALGFGPRLISHKKGETVYSIRAIPLGGFCNMTGEYVPDEEMDPEERKIYEETKQAGRCFHQQPLYQRFGVVVMGPVMNFVLAIVIFMFVFAGFGIQEGVMESTTIGQVTPGQPAEEAGLQSGDRIVSIEGTTVSDWRDIHETINARQPGQDMVLVFERNNELQQITVVPRQYQGRPMIGITSETVRRDVGILESIPLGLQNGIGWGKEIFLGFASILRGEVSTDDVGGPVAIASMTGEAARQGLENVLHFMAVISINLGIINLFPIPALDGGRILFMGIELVRRRPLDPEKEGLVHLVGFVVLMVLMVFIIFLDIRGLVQNLL